MKHIPNKQALGAADNLEAFGFQPDDPGVDPNDHSSRDELDLGWLTILLLGVAVICIVFIMSLKVAFAHNAPSGWTYPTRCCSGTDCAEISGRTVHDSPTGYRVAVAPGSHPMWPATKPETLLLIVPYAKAEASPDGRWHLCINSAGTLLCFYHVPGGM